MKANIGGADKVIRIVLGLGLLSLYFLLEGDAKWFGLIGIVPLFTALTGWCPLYLPFGFSSCPTKK